MPDPSTTDRILRLLAQVAADTAVGNERYEPPDISGLREFLDGLERRTFRDTITLPPTIQRLVGDGVYYSGTPVTGLETAALLLANYDVLRPLGPSSGDFDRLVRSLVRQGNERAFPREESGTSIAGTQMRSPGLGEIPAWARLAIGGPLLLTDREQEISDAFDLRTELQNQLEEVISKGVQGELILRRNADGFLQYRPPGRTVSVTLYDAPDPDDDGFADFVRAAALGGDLSPWAGADPKTGGLGLTDTDPSEWTLPEQPRDPSDPYIGGIPSDYVSNRLIVKPGTNFDARQRSFEERFTPDGSGQIGPGMARRGIAYATPVHEDYDQYTLFAGRDGAYRAQVQRALMDAGYLDADTVVAAGGFWTPEVAAGTKDWLFEANVNGYGNDPFRYLETRVAQGKTIKAAIDAENTRRGSGGGASVPAYRAPDYATLTQAVKQYVEAKVGRPVKDYELTILADRMAADFRAEYDSRVAAAYSGGGGGGGGGNREIEDIADYTLANVEAGLDPYAGLEAFLAGQDPTVTEASPPLWQGTYAQVDAQAGGRQPAGTGTTTTTPSGGGGGGGGGGETQDIDPYARLGENVDTMFATEIKRNTRVADIRANTQHMMNVLAGLEGA